LALGVKVHLMTIYKGVFNTFMAQILSELRVLTKDNYAFLRK